MQNKFYYRFIVALLMICPLFTSCAYLSAPGIPLHKGQEQGYFEDLIDCNKPNLPYEKAEDFELRVLDVDKDEALAAPLLLRFVWLTDVHMIQREIKLGSKIFSHALDEVAPSTEFNNAQEDFHWAVYFSQIAAINELHRKDPIDFMIHTGDSANYGSVEEIYQFIYITNKLNIPWLNIVGNHDTTILGNFLSRLGYGRDPNVIFYPVSDLGGFVWMHRSKDLSQISGYGRHLLPVPVNCQHEPSISTWPNKKLVRTFHHGFDLELGETCSTEPSENISYDSKKLGDYATDLCGIPIPVRLIALNSAKKDAFGANISINNEQREKLKKELLHESGGINLVFVHHRLDENNETEALLANHGDGTVVAFTGHKHVYNLVWHPGQNGRGFYELNGGAFFAFPQIGRVIELRGTPGGRVWLISRALWSNLMTVREKDMPSREEIKKVIAKCLTKDEDKRKAIQKNLTEAVRCGHYGAYDDYLANSEKISRYWGGGAQPFGKIWEEANMIIEIQPQKRSD